MKIKLLFPLLLLLTIACDDPGMVDDILTPEEQAAAFYGAQLGTYSGTCIRNSTDFLPNSTNLITRRDTYDNVILIIDTLNEDRIYTNGACSNNSFDFIWVKGDFEVKDTIECSSGGGRRVEKLTIYVSEKKVVTFSGAYSTGPGSSEAFGTFYKVE